MLRDMRIVVLDGYTLNPGDLSWDAFGKYGEIAVHDRTPADQIVERSRGAQVLLTNKTPLSRETMAQLPDLKYVGILATGYDHIDVRYAHERGIVVANAPGYSTRSTAQMTIALLLELCHRVGLHDESVKAGDWSRSPDFCYWKHPQVELADKTLGIVGFGAIGRTVAHVARALGMRIAVYRRPGSAGHHATADLVLDSLDDLFRIADVISLHCPLKPETRGTINARTLGLMKPSAMIINAGRGPLVVEEDLARALNEGVIAGFAADVLTTEPPRDGSPLFSARNAIITPHIAWATRESRQRLMDLTLANLAAFVQGKPVNVVS